jgi:deazaflavin-dependent oxidoreductase (nitroreductase family)
LEGNPVTIARAKDWNASIIDEFRANQGQVHGQFEGFPLLLLHHQGAKSGVERVSPLAYQAVMGGYAVFASKGGADTNPGWYHNVLANPVTTIEVGATEVSVRAREATGEAYARIWEKQKATHPAFAEYERRTARERIPVIILEPV